MTRRRLSPVGLGAAPAPAVEFTLVGRLPFDDLMELLPQPPNVELRGIGDEQIVVLAFPYDASIVNVVRGIPGRRFDWDRREWWAPVDDWVGVHVLGVIDRFPDLTASDEVVEWLAAIERRWIGVVGATRYDGRGWWTLSTRAGGPPAELLEGSITRADGALLAPLTRAGAEALAAQETLRIDAGARRCVEALLSGVEPPPARLTAARTFDGERLRLDVLWDGDAGAAFGKLPGADARSRTLPIDPWIVEPLDAFLALFGVVVDGAGRLALDALREEHAAAIATIRSSRAVSGEPLAAVAGVLGGELAPFQWAAVRYALDARRCFLADEQGLGKTVEALATLEADGAFPAIVVCPASLQAQLAARDRALAAAPQRRPRRGPGRGRADGRRHDPQLRDRRRAPRGARTAQAARARRRRVALLQEPAGQAHAGGATARGVRRRRRAAARAERDAGAQPRRGARLAAARHRAAEDFGSGAQFARRFRGELSEERLHWHLRRRCFVRRLKSEVLPQLPAKRQVVVPVALSNASEYRLAERDVIAWLRSQPLDLRELQAKIAATLRAQRLAQLGTLQRLAARGKLAASLTWIADFLASGEPLVVFARHLEVQAALIERFPDAAHLLGRDSATARAAAVDAFQSADGPQLLIGATRVAGQGITLTRASNVAFLELEWTPAMHDQAEDRCHRIGQHDAVTAWYLLAADTIDETMAELIQRKRGVIAAVTDGRQLDGDGLVEAVVRELRDGRPLRHLRPVA